MLDIDGAKYTGSYKVRKSGNSDVTTVLKDVKEALDIETGDQIEYIIDSKENVTIRKKIQQPDIDSMIEETVAQYYNLLEELVEK